MDCSGLGVRSENGSILSEFMLKQMAQNAIWKNMGEKG
jgi:hypothetical protein